MGIDHSQSYSMLGRNSQADDMQDAGESWLQHYNAASECSLGLRPKTAQSQPVFRPFVVLRPRAEESRRLCWGWACRRGVGGLRVPGFRSGVWDPGALQRLSPMVSAIARAWSTASMASQDGLIGGFGRGSKGLFSNTGSGSKGHTWRPF